MAGQKLLEEDHESVGRLLDKLRATRDDAGLHAEAESAVAALRRDHDFFMRELAAAINALSGPLSEPLGHDAEAEMGRVLCTVEAVASRL